MVNKVKKIKFCAWPYCNNEAKFPAPCDPRDLKKRIYLCQEHIIIYNKSWNGLEGFDAEEIFNMQQNPAWDKPTWKLGEKQKLQEKMFNFSHSQDKDIHGHDFFEDDYKNEDDDIQFRQNFSVPKQVQTAMDILDIQEPLDMRKLKKAYRFKVKHSHPDKHKNSKKAEEELKQINIAYEDLKKYLKIKGQ